MGRRRYKRPDAGTSVDVPRSVFHSGNDGTDSPLAIGHLAYIVHQLRWSWGVKLLSQADDEVPDVEVTITQSDHNILSPEPLQPHPGARETDPFFTTARGIRQDEADEASNPNQTVQDSSTTASTAWLADPGSVHSAHGLQGLAVRHGSLEFSRRNSSQSASGHTRRKPTRTDSGREFWGLPEAPRIQRSALSQVPMGDSSDGEDDEDHDEIVS